MKNMKKKYILVLFLFLTIMLQGQDNNNKWAVSIGGGIMNYNPKYGTPSSAVGYRWVEMLPHFTVARYVAKNLTISGSFGIALQESSRYQIGTFRDEVQVQWAARYDFGTSENIFSPYVLFGGSLISARGNTATTLDLGIGGTLWVYRRFGLTGQAMQRINYAGLESQPSHQFVSVGIVYRFNLGGENGRRRLWNFKH